MKENNSNIANNTILLYIRQIIIMIITLYTASIIINSLGPVDYGINNVVAGVVVLFSFINNSMSDSSQRFLNIAIGQKNQVYISKVFTTSILMHIVIAIIVLAFSETFGLWFITSQLNLPNERIMAIAFCYQASIFSAILLILRVPFYSTVICHEDMRFFAGISIFEVFLKLCIAFIVKYSLFDKLIIYSVLGVIVNIIILFIYLYLIIIKYKIPFRIKKIDKNLLTKMITFSGWSLLGGTAEVGKSQGINIILNIFSGVTVNAAMGIANQVSTSVYSFVSNFQLAYKPQLIKSYATEDFYYFRKMILFSSKLSFFLLTFISVPLLVNVDFVLTIWLKDYPSYTNSFIKLIIINQLICSLFGSLYMAVQAIGKIRNYQIIVSCIVILNVPLSYIFMKLGYSPNSVLIIRIFISLIALFWRIFYLKNKIDITPLIFISEVVIKCVIIFIFCFIPPFFLSLITDGVIQFFVTCTLSVVWSIVLIYFIGFDLNQKIIIKKIIKEKIKKFKKE